MTLAIFLHFLKESGAIVMGGRTSKSDDGLSISEYCAEKLQSSGKAEVSKLVDLVGDSVAPLLGKGGPRVKITTGGLRLKILWSSQKLALL